MENKVTDSDVILAIKRSLAAVESKAFHDSLVSAIDPRIKELAEINKAERIKKETRPQLLTSVDKMLKAVKGHPTFEDIIIRGLLEKRFIEKVDGFKWKYRWISDKGTQYGIFAFLLSQRIYEMGYRGIFRESEYVSFRQGEKESIEPIPIVRVKWFAFAEFIVNHEENKTFEKTAQMAVGNRFRAINRGRADGIIVPFLPDGERYKEIEEIVDRLRV